MELKKITENVYYIPNATNIGVITKGQNAILIDSGLDDNTARKILNLMKAQGLQPKAVINTHSHADHCGGNSYLKEKADVRIYAPALESDSINYPYYEPFALFSGANPVEELKNKFLMAKPSKVDFVMDDSTEMLIVEGIELRIIKLPGHAINQVGIAFEDVLFCADSFFSIKVLEKHKIPFCIDTIAQGATLNAMKTLNFDVFVPSHGEPESAIEPLVDAYLEVIDRVQLSILEKVGDGKTTEAIYSEVFTNFDIEIKGASQYYLMNAVIMAYLSGLSYKGLLKTAMRDNTLYWEKV